MSIGKRKIPEPTKLNVHGTTTFENGQTMKNFAAHLALLPVHLNVYEKFLRVLSYKTLLRYHFSLFI